jgi:hypothetical protein
MVQARDDSLDLLLDNMKKDLEAVTTLEFTDAIRRRLSDAIAPHLPTLRMLHYQEWDYKLDMVDASRKGAPVAFSPARMKRMFWEETGLSKQVCFHSFADWKRIKRMKMTTRKMMRKMKNMTTRIR